MRGETPPLRFFDVIDRAGRWKGSVRAIDEPAVTTHAGYVHVRVNAGAERPVDCFVYDAPIVTGQAVTRLLSAAEIGIRYEKVALVDIMAVANSPVVLVDAAFSDEETQGRGHLFVGLVPKVKLPIVCSQEASTPETLRSTLVALTETMLPASTFAVDSLADSEELLVCELWTLFDGEQPVGFRQWRAARHSNGRITSLEIASLLHGHGANLVTTDVRISEQTDERGLQLADWLELVDGQVRARVALQRRPIEGDPSQAEPSRGFTYRVSGLGPRGPVSTEMRSDEPLQSMYDEYVEIQRAQSQGVPFKMWRYLPYEESRTPTVVSFAPGDDGAMEGRLELGTDVFELSFDEKKRPESRRQPKTTHSSRLRLRSLGGGGT